MARRWWLLFRSLAVPTVLFFTPAIVVQQIRPLSYFLSVRGAINELALDIFAVLVLQAVCVTLLAIILQALNAFGLWNERADSNCAGLLAFIGVILCGYALLSPLDVIIGPLTNAGLEAGLILAAVISLTFFGWPRAFAGLNRLNRSAQIVLAVCPLLLIPIATGGFGWRGYDPLPPPRPLAADPSAKPNVVLITFDAMTAQDMSLYGYWLPTTPQFKRLAKRSYTFTHFYSSSDFTTPGVASLLTGQYSLTNRVFQLYGHIPHRLRHDNIAWVLRQHGYATAAIVTNPAAHPLTLRIAGSFSCLPKPPMSSWFFIGTFLMQIRHSLLFNVANGLAANTLRDFGWFLGPFNRAPWVEPRAVFAAAERYISGARRPYFLWVHLYPPHAPYLTHPPFRGRFLRGSAFTTQEQYFWQMTGPSYPPSMQHTVDLLRLRYDESVAECDNALGQFLDWMAASGRGANTILVVTSDHGENFSDGWWSHESPNLHYAETHIPLLISLPGQHRGYTESQDADLTDVAPTILTLLGIAKPPWMDGHPLIGAAQPSGPVEPAFSMYLAESNPFGRATIGAIAANSGPYHLVWYFPSGHIQLFDIARDPDELHPILAVHRSGIATALVEDIQRRFGPMLNASPPTGRR